MAAPLAAAGAARAGALAWSERRWLLWVLVLVFGVPLALVALIAAMVGGLAEQTTAPPVGSYAPSQTALADIPPPYLRVYEAAGASYGVGWEYLAAIGKVETDHCRSRTYPACKLRRERNALLRRADAVQHPQRSAVDVGQLPGTATGRRHEPVGPRGRDPRRRPLSEGQRRARGLGRRDLRLQPRRLVRRRGPGLGGALPRPRDHRHRRAGGLAELAAAARRQPLAGAGARHQRDLRLADRSRRRAADAPLPAGRDRLLRA